MSGEDQDRGTGCWNSNLFERDPLRRPSGILWSLTRRASEGESIVGIDPNCACPEPILAEMEHVFECEFEGAIFGLSTTGSNMPDLRSAQDVERLAVERERDPPVLGHHRSLAAHRLMCCLPSSP